MKCDELKPFNIVDSDLQEFCEPRLVYSKSDVDAAVAELKEVANDACLERDDNRSVIDELDVENRRLKRALWLARADRAVAKQAYYDILSRGISIERDEMYDVWNDVELKCRAKAEECK